MVQSVWKEQAQTRIGLEGRFPGPSGPNSVQQQIPTELFPGHKDRTEALASTVDNVMFHP